MHDKRDESELPMELRLAPMEDLILALALRFDQFIFYGIKDDSENSNHVCKYMQRWGEDHLASIGLCHVLSSNINKEIRDSEAPLRGEF